MGQGVQLYCVDNHTVVMYTLNMSKTHGPREAQRGDAELNRDPQYCPFCLSGIEEAQNWEFEPTVGYMHDFCAEARDQILREEEIEELRYTAGDDAFTAEFEEAA
jgi:hypothetical protein